MTAPADPNIYEPCTEHRAIDGYDGPASGLVSGRERSARREPVGAVARQAAYPLHFHYVEEEMLIVLDGEPLLRQTQAGGDSPGRRGVVPPGARGVHQLFNDSDQVIRFLVVSTSGAPDIVSYPEQGKIGVFERPPGDGQLWSSSGWRRPSGTPTAWSRRRRLSCSACAGRRNSARPSGSHRHARFSGVTS